MPKLWYDQAAIDTVTATDAQTGYEATNIEESSIRKEWRAGSAGAKTIDIVLVDAGPVAAIYLHSVNFAAGDCKFSVDGVTFSAAIPFEAEFDIHGRGRVLVELGEATVKTIRFEISAGTPTDDAAFWRIGAAYPMASVVEQLGPEWGYQINQVKAQVSQELSNKQKGVARTGTDLDDITIAFKPRAGEDLSPLVRRTRQATCIWTTDLAAYPAEIWPVTCIDDRFIKTRENIPQTAFQLTLREVVA
jgi:hypothetical protein